MKPFRRLNEDKSAARPSLTSILGHWDNIYSRIRRRVNRTCINIYLGHRPDSSDSKWNFPRLRFFSEIFFSLKLLSKAIKSQTISLPEKLSKTSTKNSFINFDFSPFSGFTFLPFFFCTENQKSQISFLTAFVIFCCPLLLMKLNRNLSEESQTFCEIPNKNLQREFSGRRTGNWTVWQQLRPRAFLSSFVKFRLLFTFWSEKNVFHRLWNPRGKEQSREQYWVIKIPDATWRLEQHARCLCWLTHTHAYDGKRNHKNFKWKRKTQNRNLEHAIKYPSDSGPKLGQMWRWCCKKILFHFMFLPHKIV